jgi:hypothetical protein
MHRLRPISSDSATMGETININDLTESVSFISRQFGIIRHLW